MKYLIVILLFTSCSASFHMKRALKKDSDYFKKVADTRIRHFKTDTIITVKDGRVDTVLQPYAVIEYITNEVQTWKEKRVDNKIAVLELKEARQVLKRSKLLTDSLELANDYLKSQIKNLKANTKKTQQETKAIKKENRSNSIQWVLENWWWILLIIGAIILSIKTGILKK